MNLSCRLPDDLNKANKVYVNTTYSSDGHYLEGYWLEYNPDDPYALFLLEHTLDSSAGVDYYSVYNAEGKRTPPGVRIGPTKRI